MMIREISICVSFIILLIFISLLFFVIFKKKEMKLDGDLFFGSLICSAISLLFFVMNCFAIIKIIVAPKLYLVEYFKNII